jgi:hypothetical protein
MHTPWLCQETAGNLEPPSGPNSAGSLWPAAPTYGQAPLPEAKLSARRRSDIDRNCARTDERPATQTQNRRLAPIERQCVSPARVPDHQSADSGRSGTAPSLCGRRAVMISESARTSTKRNSACGLSWLWMLQSRTWRREHRGKRRKIRSPGQLICCRVVTRVKTAPRTSAIPDGAQSEEDAETAFAASVPYHERGGKKVIGWIELISGHMASRCFHRSKQRPRLSSGRIS